LVTGHPTDRGARVDEQEVARHGVDQHRHDIFDARAVHPTGPDDLAEPPSSGR
jgi:hypothetical protein